MKYVILVGDGMSDRPLAELNGRTPLEVARTSFMDRLANGGLIGLSDTIPRGMSSASDVANLSILGYDPAKYYSGRGPLEAANLGIVIGPMEVAFRCNLISVDRDVLADYSAGHITDKEAKILIDFLSKNLGNDSIKFYHGTSYRNLVVIRAKDKEHLRDLIGLSCTPPHNITGKSVAAHLPKGRGTTMIVKLMEDSRKLLESHEINKVRLDLKENPGNMIWLWGQGTNPNLPQYKELFGLSGAVISAVDLIKGIGRLIGLEVIDVPGATGYYDTNYKGKGEYALKCLAGHDFVFVHVEAPDEAGHNGDLRAKIETIENFDKFVIGTIVEGLKGASEYRIMVLSDHATPVSLRTHADDPVPFVIYGSGIEPSGAERFNEKTAKLSKIKFKSAAELTKFFMNPGTRAPQDR